MPKIPTLVDSGQILPIYPNLDSNSGLIAPNSGKCNNRQLAHLRYCPFNKLRNSRVLSLKTKKYNALYLINPKFFDQKTDKDKGLKKFG